MIDITRIHSDFRKMPFFLNTNYKSLNSFESDQKRPEYCSENDMFEDYNIFKHLEQEYRWLNNQYCPCCATHHDMILVDHNAINRNIIKKNEIEIDSLVNPYVDDLPFDTGFVESPENKEKRERDRDREVEERKDIIKRYKVLREEDRFYCPYYSKTHTGWDLNLYKMLCTDYEQVYRSGNGEYISKINIIKNILENNKAIVSLREICTSKVTELVQSAAKLEREIEELQNRVPELQRYAQFLKENKEKTSKIIKSARKLESGLSGDDPVWNGAHQEYWRRVFDEFPGSIFQDGN